MATASMQMSEALSSSLPQVEPDSPNQSHSNGLFVHKNGALIRSSSPTGSVRSAFHGSSRRRIVRRSGSFTRLHRSAASEELAFQAESEFLALMELMSGISRRSTSLKEVWTKILSERESYASEMERMYEQFDEYSETIARHEKERHGHNHEHEERKREVSKLRLELSAAVSTSAMYKKKLSERDSEFGRVRDEYAELRDSHKYLREEHEQMKKLSEETQMKLIASENARLHAEGDAKKQHSDFTSLDLKHAELQTTYNELSTKFESTHKELISHRQSVSVYKKEKEEWLYEKGESEDRVRKSHHRTEELKQKIKELTESFEKKKHELSEVIETKRHEVRDVKETLSKIKFEREELQHKSKELRRELDEEHRRKEDAEDRAGSWKLKWEQLDREIASLREEMRVTEIERSELHETITKKVEEYRGLVFEKKQFEKDYHGKCKESEDRHREMLVIQESLRRTELTIKEKNEQIHSLRERIERIERDRTEVRGRCSDLETDLSGVQTSVASLKLDIETITSEREALREKLRETENKYEEMYESVTETQEGNSSFEFEISSLRAMLREAREEREKAITLRMQADRERDEATARFEAKCREMDQLEENLALRYHAHEEGSSGSRTVSRTVSKHYSTVTNSE